MMPVVPWTKCNRPPATLVAACLIVSTAVLGMACNRPQPGCDSAGSARRSGGWELGIRAPHSVRRGDSVTLALVLRNVGDSVVDLQLGANEDFRVNRAGDTTEVWSKLHRAQVLSLLLRKRAVSPGDSISIKYKWDQVGNDRKPVRPGVYCVGGDLRENHGLDSLRTEQATLRVLR